MGEKICLNSSLLSLPGGPGLLRPAIGAGLRHCGGRLRHLHLGLAQELPLRRLPVSAGPLRPPRPPAALLQQPGPGGLPGPRRAPPAHFPVPQRVHRHQLLPQAARPQPGQRVGGVQEAQHATERGHAVVRGARSPAPAASPPGPHRRASGQEAGEAQPAQLRQLQPGGERLRELRGGDVLRAKSFFHLRSNVCLFSVIIPFERLTVRVHPDPEAALRTSAAPRRKPSVSSHRLERRVERELGRLSFVQLLKVQTRRLSWSSPPTPCVSDVGGLVSDVKVLTNDAVM